MAIISGVTTGVRGPDTTELMVGQSVRTELIWWTDTGEGSKESHRQVSAGNKSTAMLGRVLPPGKDRTTFRSHPIAYNNRADEAVP